MVFGPGDLQRLIVHPWVGAALAGLLLGLAGAGVFIAVCRLLDAAAEERRRRDCLLKCGLLDETAPGGEVSEESAALQSVEGSRVLRL